MIADGVVVTSMHHQDELLEETTGKLYPIIRLDDSWWAEQGNPMVDKSTMDVDGSRLPQGHNLQPS